MTNTNRLALLAGVTMLLLSAVAPAQDLKIGYVNINAIIQNAPQIPDIDSQLRDEFAPRESSVRSLQEELQEKAENYERDRDVMGEAERTSLERELTQGQRDLERRATELQEDIQIRQNELLGELQVEILQKVQDYAEEEGYDLVVTQAVWVSQAIDITASVYEAIGGTLPEE